MLNKYVSDTLQQRSEEAEEELTLKLTLLRTLLASAVLMALSNWRRT